MLRFIKVLWVLSMLGFLASALFVYADIGDANTIVQLRLDASGESAFGVSKINFFYVSLFIMLGINVIILLTGYSVPYLPKSLVLAPQKELWLSTPHNRKNFYKRMKDWARGFATIINFFLTCVIFTIYYMNSRNYFPLAWTYYLCAILAIAWLFAFFPIFKKNPDLVDTDVR